MKPRIFIGSSVEGKPIANAIQANLAHDAYPTVWDQNIFRPSSSEASAVLVTSRYFEMAGLLKGHAGQYLGSKHQFKVPFLAYTDKSGKDIYRIEHFVKPSESVRAWLALDSATEDEAARDALAKSQVGTWRVTCHWIDEPMELRQYDFEF